MRSGIRAPEDSPMKTSGIPRLVATSLMWRNFFWFMTALEAPEQ